MKALPYFDGGFLGKTLGHNGINTFINSQLNYNRSSWSRGSVSSSNGRGQRFEPRCRQYFKLLLDPGDFHSNHSGLLSFNKSETVLWTIAKYYYYLFSTFAYVGQIGREISTKN